ARRHAGPASRPGGREPFVQRVGVEPTFADDACACDFAPDIAPQTVATDPYDVFRRPMRWRIPEQREFRWKELRLRGDQVDVGVDASDERGRDLLRIRAVREPLAIHVAAIQEETRRAIGIDVVGPEHGGELTQTTTSPEIDLPQAIACRVEALHEERVVVRTGIDVRYTPFVHEYLCRRVQVAYRERLRRRSNAWRGKQQPNERQERAGQRSYRPASCGEPNRPAATVKRLAKARRASIV